MTKEQKLNKQVEEQRASLSKLSGRISQLVDRIVMLEEDIGTFKTKVGVDVQVLDIGIARLAAIVKKEKTF